MLLALLSAALLWVWGPECWRWLGQACFAQAKLLKLCDPTLFSHVTLRLVLTLKALLQIRLPKTRGRVARHQVARIDPPDVIRLLDLCFGTLRRTQRLWPLSLGTLQRRFRAMEEKFGLCSNGPPHRALLAPAWWCDLMLAMTDSTPRSMVVCKSDGNISSRS